MGFILRQLQRFGHFLLRLIGELIGSIIRAVGDMLMSGMRRLGRFIARLALWVIGALIAIWLIQNQPNIVTSILGIAILGYLIWWMVSSPFRKRRK